MENSLYKPAEVAYTCHSTFRRLKHEGCCKFKTSLGYRVCSGSLKYLQLVHCDPSLKKKKFCFACFLYFLFILCVGVIYVGIVLPQVNIEVRRQLVAVISLLPVYGFRGSNSMCQPWRQAPLPTQQSRQPPPHTQTLHFLF